MPTGLRTRLRAWLERAGERWTPAPSALALRELIDGREAWLFRHFPADVATYQYDIFLKSSQKRLARRLGLDVAETYVGPAPLAAVVAYVRDAAPQRLVVKPDSGRSAIGVRRLAREGAAFRDLATGKPLAPEALEAQLLRSGFPSRRDAWLAEELLVPARGPGEPLEDFKFYCFGGTAEIILHKWPAARGGSRRNWYDRDWRPVLASVKGPNHAPPGGPTRPAEMLAIAERAAAQLCYPFVRIDLYDTDRGVVFGEFTPGPGAVETFLEPVAQRFVERWHAAEAALLEAVRSGAVVPLGPDHAESEPPA